MEHISYGPPTCTYGPPTCEVSSCLMTLMVPHTLYGIGILWSPYMYIWSPHMYNLMAPLPYMEQVLSSPPTCTILVSPLFAHVAQ